MKRGLSITRCQERPTPPVFVHSCKTLGKEFVGPSPEVWVLISQLISKARFSYLPICFLAPYSHFRVHLPSDLISNRYMGGPIEDLYFLSCEPCCALTIMSSQEQADREIKGLTQPNSASTSVCHAEFAAWILLQWWYLPLKWCRVQTTYETVVPHDFSPREDTAETGSSGVYGIGN